MKIKKFFGSVIFSFCLIGIVLSGNVFADINVTLSTTYGGVVVVDGSTLVPANVEDGSHPFLLPKVFKETEGVLGVDVDVDITASGYYFISNQGALGLFGPLTSSPGTIPAGTTVKSYLLNFDTILDDPALGFLQNAAVVFDEEIIGVVVQPGLLDVSDFLGHPSIGYPTSDGDRAFHSGLLKSQMTIDFLGSYINISFDDHEGQGQIRVLTVGPTVVSLVDFTATSTIGGVDLEWVTETETDNSGFNIWRSEGDTGNFIKINDSLILAQGGASWGAEYSFADSDVKRGRTYHYQLEDVELDGDSSLNGPVSVKVERQRKLGKN